MGIATREGPSLVRSEDVTGCMALNRLIRMGVLTRLDNTCGYRNDYANTLIGRAMIVEPMIPYGATAAGKLALWVWVGGRFPTCFDLVSTSHYRARVHGRDVHVHNRRMMTNQVMRLAELKITSPIRTACDLACMAPAERQGCDVNRMIVELMQRYSIDPDQCLDTLWCNQRWPRHSLGITTFMALKNRRESWDVSYARQGEGQDSDSGSGSGSGRRTAPDATAGMIGVVTNTTTAQPSPVGRGAERGDAHNVRPDNGRPAGDHGPARRTGVSIRSAGSA